MTLSALVGTAFAAEECTAPASRSAMALAETQAWSAFLALDEPAFSAAHAIVGRSLPCLREILPPNEVAQVHGLAAGAAFLAGSDASAVDAFRGALAAEPAFDLPQLPATHPLRAQLDVARGMGAAPARPVGRGTVVDGVPSSEAPSDRPTFLQHQAQGVVDHGAYVAVGGALPAWAQVTTHKRPVALIAGTAVGAVAAGSLLIAAGSERAAFLSPETPQSELQSRFDRTNTLSWAAVGTGVLTLGLGIGVGLTW